MCDVTMIEELGEMEKMVWDSGLEEHNDELIQVDWHMAIEIPRGKAVMQCTYPTEWQL